MDGSKVVEPHFLIKLVKHGLHSSLCSQVVAYEQQQFNTKKTTLATLIPIVVFSGFKC